MPSLKRICPHCTHQLGDGSAERPWQCAAGLARVTIVRPCERFQARPELRVGYRPPQLNPAPKDPEP